MPALTPSYLFDLESNMRVITATDYQRLNSNTWWRSVAKPATSGASKERLIWLLDTARIQRTGHGGNIEFEDLVSQTQELEHLNAAAGLEIRREQFEDTDGNGVNFATQWARQIGAYAAYWPQKMTAQAILANPTTYDGLSYFNAAHPLNPYNTSAGTYANVFTGAASGIYPGAIPIGSGTVDVAVANLAKAIAYVSAIKMPNGEDPRFLRLAGIMVPPALTARAQQLTNAKFIAQAAASGGGSGDVEAVIRNFGFGQPIEAPELSSAFSGGSDTTYYLLMEDILTSDMGAFTYSEREAFAVLYYGPQSDADLARRRKLQWTTEGRNVLKAGHPYLCFQCKAT